MQGGGYFFCVGLQNTSPPPIGTSYGGLRNFRSDQHRIPPPLPPNSNFSRRTSKLESSNMANTEYHPLQEFEFLMKDFV